MLLRTVAIEGRVLEPAAGQGHLSLELKRAGLDVTSFDIRRYEDPLVPDIGVGDIRQLESLAGYDWVVSNLPYESLTELTAHRPASQRATRCGVALIVRSQWLVPKARAKLNSQASALRRRSDDDQAAALGRRRRKRPQHRLVVRMERDAARRRRLDSFRLVTVGPPASASEARPSLIHP